MIGEDDKEEEEEEIVVVAAAAVIWGLFTETRAGHPKSTTI